MDVVGSCAEGRREEGRGRGILYSVEKTGVIFCFFVFGFDFGF